MKRCLQRESIQPNSPWEESAHAPVLTPGVAHIWLMDLSPGQAALEHYASFLSQPETERAFRFRFEKDRNAFMVGRGLLRRLLGDYVKADPASLSFSYNRFGKPLLEQHNPDLHFNLSHSHGFAVLGFVLKAELGVDIEKIRPDFATREIAERFFAPDEVAVLTSLPPEQQADAFFRCWTRKEAFIKAHGIGLSFGLDKFSVAFHPDASPALLRCDLDPDAAQQWSILNLPVPNNYLGALAVKTVPCQLRLLRPTSLDSTALPKR
jgi:4'-phosphopantetheinyl transferase